MDFKFLAGFSVGFIASIPIVIVVCYYAYLKISAQVRAIVNEFGRG
ncbi:P3a protein [Luteovirus sociomali]|uniref:P3a protein n=1 Tax=Luteovirus sociomali TaxID=2054409 RepID=A0A2H4QXD6_9TOMB|nr:P3a protein [Luteovirus sociomali]ATY36303.1 P3a protein [Luteovirus sociomali]